MKRKTYLGWYQLNGAWIHPKGYAKQPPQEVVDAFCAGQSDVFCTRCGTKLAVTDPCGHCKGNL